jgi:hypothetical protein
VTRPLSPPDKAAAGNNDDFFIQQGYPNRCMREGSHGLEAGKSRTDHYDGGLG